MSNPVQTENALPGSAGWVLTNPATNREIEGYASLTSVNRGNTINFFVSTSGPYTIDIYRMGWYGGTGARKMPGSPITLTGTLQHIPEPTVDGLFECEWALSHTLSVPNDWVSGVYVAKLTQSKSGKQSYIIFVVRDDDRVSDYLFQSSVTTFQAYNNWPGKSRKSKPLAREGKSLYDHNSSGGRATRVSFNRPYAIDLEQEEHGHHPGPFSGLGAGEFFTVQNLNTDIIHSAAWEYNMVRFLEREGFDVTYCTNIDTHANGQNLLSPLLHKGFLSVGHDEYWSLEMRNNVGAARDSGVSLGFFGANIAYWQIRLEPSGNNPNRTMVCCKYNNKDETGGPRDPLYTPDDHDSSNDANITVQWRDPVLQRPEDELIGVMFDIKLIKPTIPDNNIVVTNTSHWVFRDTGLQDGQVLPGLLGYEVDRRFGNAPVGTVTLAQSPPPPSDPPRYSDMTIYTAPSGAIVFATGSLQWSWGLDDYNAPTLRPSRLSDEAQQITRNVLKRMHQTSATFVWEDKMTQGNWKSVYGADGYNIVKDATKKPDYVAPVLVTGAKVYPETKNVSSADERWLQKAASGSTERNFTVWYSETDFTIDINLTDGQEHRVAIYCLDWDENDGRSQRIEVLDAATGVVLDTRDMAAFSAGRYLVWQLKGHVLIRITHTGGPGSNAVVSGLFFGSHSSATFVEADDTTQGNWKSVYGADGYNVIEDARNYPDYAQVLVSADGPPVKWEDPTADERGLQKAASGSTERIAATWYSGTSFIIDIDLRDGQEHRVAVYCFDWERANQRSQKVEVLDAANNVVLDTRPVAAFSAGRYLVWQLRGHVLIRITHTGVLGSNAVVSGLFFGSPSSATFVGEDRATQGNWKGVYGADGYNIIEDATKRPSYAAPVLFTGEEVYPETKNVSSADERWLQKAASGSTERNFTVWYSATNFTIDINLTDGQEHRVAIYCLDWDEYDGRSQKIEVLDAATNAVLDARDVGGFSLGRYLIWQLKGHVRIRITHTGGVGSNAVVSGLFFN